MARDDFEKQYTQALGFGNGVATIVTDGGNSFWKMVYWDTGIKYETVFDHAIAEIDKSEYDRKMYYIGDKFAPHLLRVSFAGEDRYFIVGEEAYSVKPNFEPERGRSKYKRDYYGVMFLSGVLRLTRGNVPEKVNAFLAHPPGDVEFRMELMKSVAGKWKFECSGVVYDMRVEYTSVADEFTGGVMDMTLGTDGSKVKDRDIETILNPRNRILIADMGGGSFDLAQMWRGAIDYTAPITSVRIGLQQAIDAAKREIDRLHRKDLLDAESGYRRDDVLRMFMDEKHRYQIYGEEKDGTEIYKTAVAPVVRQASNSSRQYAGGLVGFAYVLLTGGGSGALWQEIGEYVFPEHNSRKGLRMVTTPAAIHKANAHGLAKMLPGMIAVSFAAAKKLKRSVR